MPQLGQAMVACEGRCRLARWRCWVAICPAMYSPRRAGVTDSHMNALWGRRGKQNLGEKVRKRSANGLAFRRGWRETVKRKSARMRFILSYSAILVTPGHQISQRSLSADQVTTTVGDGR